MINVAAFFDELVKLSAVSTEDARRSLDRLDTLERGKPTPGRVATYAGLGAVSAPLISAIGSKIEGRPMGGMRGMAASAVKGALGMGAVPLVRAHLDRRAEMGTLKDYVRENNLTRQGA